VTQFAADQGMVLSTPPSKEEADFRDWFEGQRPQSLSDIHQRRRNAWMEKLDKWDGVSEQVFVASLIDGLSPMFDVHSEVWGTRRLLDEPPRRVRVDLVCLPKPGLEWPLGAFVIEAKRPDRGGTRQLGDHIKQAVDYLHTTWDGFGRLPVFLAPGLQGLLDDDVYENARRVLGGLSIGEVFVAPGTSLVSIFLSSQALIIDGMVTTAGAKRRKAGLGVGSSHV
jgi:hypothetical protein